MNKKEQAIFIYDGDFPPLLKEISAPPEKIFWRGEKSLLKNDFCLAVVGTRKATFQGRELARKISRELAEVGAVIVSGLAMGIDSAAHEGALEAAGGQGKTIAVLGGGIDKIYPAQNENLADRIITGGGLIVSEYPPATPTYPSQFLERNRVVSGLSLATIVIEAPLRSGSLNTARLAAEQGREVFVFPGPTGHPNFAGSHALIRDGARLVSSAQDIFEDLGLELKSKNDFSENDFSQVEDAVQREILRALFAAGRPLPIDKISQITNLEPHEANQALALLIIEGKIKETGKGYTI